MPPKKCKKQKVEQGQLLCTDLQLSDDVIDMLELDLDTLTHTNTIDEKLLLQNQLKQKIQQLLLKIDELTARVENAGSLQDADDLSCDAASIITDINNGNQAISTEEFVENAVKLYETNMKKINKLKKKTDATREMVVKKVA